ncbi:zinc finger protein [Trichonephila clavipes]|nr:zinc finger protein [Trichonephila clavipes]
MRISRKRLTIWKTTFAVLLPIYGHKCWKKSSKIGRPDWTTSEPAVAVLCQKSYLKERDDDKLEGIEVPVVHSLMIFKMCEGLGLQAQLAAESDRKIWFAKKKPRPIPKVHSKTILMFCEALDLDAELAH